MHVNKVCHDFRLLQELDCTSNCLMVVVLLSVDPQSFAVQVDKNGKSAPRNAAKTEQRGAEKAANVRWYDSRSREALHLVAEWLQLPWDKVVLYECLLAQQAQVGKHLCYLALSLEVSEGV